MIIDCHTHILPAMDDGARDPDVSLEMLKESSRQGVDLIIATPHFYGSRDRMDSFIRRRDASKAIISELLRTNEGLPGVKLGAEVAYFPGIGRADGIEKLCIEGTNALLLEMPFKVWEEKIIDEVASLVYDRNLQVILAHIERYTGFPGQRKKLGILSEMPVTFQVNAGSLLQEGMFKKKSSQELISWFETGRVGVMGSDCHNMSWRRPNLLAGRNRLSAQTLENIDYNAAQLMGV